jgi:hypothetical protein
MQISRQIRLLIRLGELLAKQQGEIQLLLQLLKQQGEMQLLLLADPSGTPGEGIGPADTTSGRVLLLQSPSCCRKRTRLQQDGTGGGAETTPTGYYMSPVTGYSSSK